MLIKITILFWLLLSLRTKRNNILPCGLIGYIGSEPFNVDKIKMLMILNLERGTDSTGIWNQGKITKTINKCNDFLEKTPIVAEKIFIGHTRNKSIGCVTESQAHPFQYGDVIGAHNGTISNWTDLKDKYGFTYSDVSIDSQVVFKAIGDEKDIDVLGMIRGGTAVVYVDNSIPDTLFCYRNDNLGGRPLFRGKIGNGMYISSLENSLKIIGCTKVEEFKSEILYEIKDGKILTNRHIKQDPYTKPYVKASSVNTDDDDVYNYNSFNSFYNKGSEIMERNRSNFADNDVRRVESISEYYKNHRTITTNSEKTVGMKKYGEQWFWSIEKAEHYRIYCDPKTNEWSYVFDIHIYEKSHKQDNRSEKCLSVVPAVMSLSDDKAPKRVELWEWNQVEALKKYPIPTSQTKANLFEKIDNWKNALKVTYPENDWWFIHCNENTRLDKTLVVREAPFNICLGYYDYKKKMGYVYERFIEKPLKKTDTTTPIYNIKGCLRCNGTGVFGGEDCVECSGSGDIWEERIENQSKPPVIPLKQLIEGLGDDKKKVEVECTKCDGTGSFQGETIIKCSECDGTGKIMVEASNENPEVRADTTVEQRIIADEEERRKEIHLQQQDSQGFLDWLDWIDETIDEHADDKSNLEVFKNSITDAMIDQPELLEVCMVKFGHELAPIFETIGAVLSANATFLQACNPLTELQKGNVSRLLQTNQALGRFLNDYSKLIKDKFECPELNYNKS